MHYDIVPSKGIGSYPIPLDVIVHMLMVMHVLPDLSTRHLFQSGDLFRIRPQCVASRWVHGQDYHLISIVVDLF